MAGWGSSCPEAGGGAHSLQQLSPSDHWLGSSDRLIRLSWAPQQRAEPWAGQRASSAIIHRPAGKEEAPRGHFPAPPCPWPQMCPSATHEFTHRTTMFFHRFRVPTIFTMQTFLGLRDSSFSSSAEKESVTSPQGPDQRPRRQPGSQVRRREQGERFGFSPLSQGTEPGCPDSGSVHRL